MRNPTKFKASLAIASSVATTLAGAAHAQSATDVTIYGFVRAEAFYDLDFDQGDISNTAGLDTAAETDGTFNTSVRVSRLGVRASSDTDIGTVSGQLEYDLFGSAGTAELRLRHANLSAGNFLVGQTWTNFMPIGQYPTTADFNGPVGVTFARVPQLRYSGGSGPVKYSASIEEAVWASDDPALTAAVEYGSDLFTVRGAVIGGTVLDALDSEEDVFGVTLSATANPWQGGTLSGIYTAGEGIGDLLIGGGSALAADGDANEVEGYVVQIRQDIGSKFNVGIAYGYEEYDNPGAENLSELETIHVNAFYKPVDNLNLGIEYIMGERTDGAGDTLEAERIGVSATFTF